MATEYETVKLIDQHSAWDPVQPSRMNASHMFDRCANGKPIRSITRDGGVVTVRHLESGRSVEFPWSSVRHAVVLVPKAEAKK